jgi:hypothetical protein
MSTSIIKTSYISTLWKPSFCIQQSQLLNIVLIIILVTMRKHQTKTVKRTIKKVKSPSLTLNSRKQAAYQLSLQHREVCTAMKGEVKVLVADDNLAECSKCFFFFRWSEMVHDYYM